MFNFYAMKRLFLIAFLISNASLRLNAVEGIQSEEDSRVEETHSWSMQQARLVELGNGVSAKGGEIGIIALYLKPLEEFQLTTQFPAESPAVALFARQHRIWNEELDVDARREKLFDTVNSYLASYNEMKELWVSFPLEQRALFHAEQPDISPVYLESLYERVLGKIIYKIYQEKSWEHSVGSVPISE